MDLSRGAAHCASRHGATDSASSATAALRHPHADVSVACRLPAPQGYHALQTHRIAHALWNRGQRVMAVALQSRVSEVLAVDIHPAARLGRGILLDHGTGVVIGETAIIGNNVSLLQVRRGARPQTRGMPTRRRQPYALPHSTRRSV